MILNKGTKTKYVAKSTKYFKLQWIYQRALINKQLLNKKANIKRKSKRHRARREPLQTYEEHTEL